MMTNSILPSKPDNTSLVQQFAPKPRSFNAWGQLATQENINPFAKATTIPIRIFGFTKESFVDGPGIRIVVFVQGCNNVCPYCHNPNSWDINGGDEYTVSEIIKKIKTAYATKSYTGGLNGALPSAQKKKAKASRKIQGVTFSGGEPFMQAAALAMVAKVIKPLGLDITTYTGYLYEDLVKSNDTDTHALLNLTDYLIDGPYIHSQRDIGLKFRGSANQRIIDMNKTRESEKLVLCLQ